MIHYNRAHLKAHDRGDNRHDKGVSWLRVGRRKNKTRPKIPPVATTHLPNPASSAHTYDVP